MSEWVNSERYEAFVHVTRSNFHDITETGKNWIHIVKLSMFSSSSSSIKLIFLNEV